MCLHVPITSWQTEGDKVEAVTARQVPWTITLELGECWAGGHLGYVGSSEVSSTREVRLKKRR